MKKITFILAFAFLTTTLIAQKKTTTSATIIFDATTSKDALPKAENKTVVAALDTKKGTIAFEAIMKSFAFSNPTMQTHFNDKKWLDTDTYPTSKFTGKITNFKSINFKKDGTYNADVAGDLTIHGKTQFVKTTGSITVNNKKITATSDFTIKLEDYDVKGGAITGGKVAAEPKIRVVAEFH